MAGRGMYYQQKICQDIDSEMGIMALQKRKLLVFVVVLACTVTGLFLTGFLFRIVGGYIGIIWGVVAAAAMGGTYLIFLWKLIFKAQNHPRIDDR